MARRPIVAALTVAVTAIGCDVVAPGEPAWFRDREPLPACGDVVVHGDEAIDPELNRCLLRGLANGRGAELVVRMREPIQGLASDAYTRVFADGSGELILHLDPERSGVEGWERHECADVQISDPAAPSLTLSDCEQTTPAPGEGR